MNDKDILLLSATYPINTGPIAPPTGDIIKKEEARLVLFPNPFKDMAKIVGNMMASNTYTKNKATNEIPVNHLFQQYAILKNAIREMGGYEADQEID